MIKRALLCALFSVLAAAGGCAERRAHAAEAKGQARPGALQACETLSGARADGLSFTATRVASGALSVGGKPIGAHCLVSGKLNERVSAIDGQAYAIGFEMRLPEAWNGRFFHQANGGMDGVVVPATGTIGAGALTNALGEGFAVLSSDAGHNASQNPGFGRDPQARLDYGYQAVGKLTPIAKQIVAAAYGRGPDRSYFGGCSNGGRHTFVAASRYFADYDGFVAGAPGWQLPKAAVANIYGAQRYATLVGAGQDLSLAFTPEERRLLSNTVVARCDLLDGVKDGMVLDSDACQSQFSLARDVRTCASGRNGTCLSAAQKAVIGDIFAGARTSKGAPIYASFPYDSGHAGGDVAFWEFIAPLQLDSAAVGIVFAAPPQKPEAFAGPAFALSASVDALNEGIGATDGLYTESSLSFMRPVNPGQLAGVRDRGGKIIVYHGVSDAIFSADDTKAWIKSVRETNTAADTFVRYFPVPGMGHCGGGPSTDQADYLGALVAWVEQGRAPDAIVAGARGPGNPGGANSDVPANWSATRTRPLCPWPRVARYSGRGDIERAESFVCR